MATRDDIFNTFWPSLSIKEATNVFHVTKRKVNEILGFETRYRVDNYAYIHRETVGFRLLEQTGPDGAPRPRRPSDLG